MIIVAGLAGALAVSPAARADDDKAGLHLALLAGLGVGYGLAGANLEARFGHIALDVGGGVASVGILDADPPAFQIGLRAFLGQGEGLMLSVHGVPDIAGTLTPPDSRMILVGATLGWRFRFTHFLLDLGAGALRVRERSLGGRNPVDGYLPDLDLGIGWEF